MEIVSAPDPVGLVRPEPADVVPNCFRAIGVSAVGTGTEGVVGEGRLAWGNKSLYKRSMGALSQRRASGKSSRSDCLSYAASSSGYVKIVNLFLTPFIDGTRVSIYTQEAPQGRHPL